MTTLEKEYENRKLSDGFPELGRLAHETYFRTVSSRTDDALRMERLMGYMERISDLKGARNLVVLGCGPRPEPIACLKQMGHHVIGIEPVASFVATAQEFIGESATIMQGAAERIPLPGESQDLVIFDSVLEHVDSIPASLAEIYRVISPGGMLFLVTNNRHHFSWRGRNGEFNLPFYNWFPRLVKEGYIFKHLHYDPSLADFTERPAVHWHSYADLCRYGRDAGFAQFYSLLDLVRQNDPSISRSRIRRFLLPRLQRNPWLRALALTQTGNSIVMVKRK